MSPNSPPSPSRASSVTSISSSSPFRRRFDRQTRREAWRNRLKKSPTKDDRKEVESDNCFDASEDTVRNTENSHAILVEPPRVSLTSSLMDRAVNDEKKSLICRTATDATASSSEQAPRGYSESNDTASEQTPTTSRQNATDFPGEADHAEPAAIRRGPQHLEQQETSDTGERFYRVVYKGVVALVTRPDSQSARSGAYVSYGEFVSSGYETEVEELESLASSSQSGSKPHFLRSPNNSDSGLCVSPDSPPTSVMSQGAGSVSSLDTLKTASSTGVQRSHYPAKTQVSVVKRAIRVDKVLTGGYAVDAVERKRPAEGTKTPKRSNAHYLPLIGPSPLPLVRANSPRGTDNGKRKAQPDVLGYIFDYKKNIALVEPCRSPPQIESGSFVYQVVSSTPLPILTGPCIDAPITRAMVLPGTTHEVCLRMTMDDGEITFLRLSHRRGWITNRKVSTNGDSLKISIVPAVREVLPNAGSVADESSVSGLSLASSAVLSTPGSITRRRHRPPRRRRQVPTETVEAQMRQTVRTPGDPFRTPTKSRFPPFSEARKIPSSPAVPVPIQAARSKVLSPSSNVSLLSEEDYSIDSGRNAAPASVPQTPEGQSIRPPEESLLPTYFLMRVNAPRGLKILDAPHFQVSNLIRGNGSSSTTPSSSPAVRKDANNVMTPGGHSIFQTMGTGTMTMASATKTASSAVFDAAKRSRVLPRGTLFEASKRLEASSSFTEGEGLVQLSDRSGWAIIPKRKELDFQYRNYLGGVANVREGEATRAYEEVGNAIANAPAEMAGEPSKIDFVWFRVLARNGVPVECPPHASLPLVEGDQSPATSSLAGSSTSGGGGSASTSEVASSVGSSFLDAMFRTPRKRDGEVRVHETTKVLPTSIVNSSNTIPCGMSVKVDGWDDQTNSSNTTFVSQEYVRLCGGQGWIPRSIAGKPVVEEIAKPDLRFGSFWFRVVLHQGIKVRLGPSRRASSIKSEDGIYFRFECGEFLRASEVVTSFDGVGVPSECFAKLYRNRHVRMNEGKMEHRLLTSYTAAAEWVQVFGDNRLCLEECVDEPKIKRHKDGWRFNVIVESGVMVRRGPSFLAESTGITLLPGESILVIEQVAPPAESMLWLRLKDGQGWVHDLDKNGVRLMVAHSLRHRVKAAMSESSRAEEKEGTEIAYNAIVARLFTQNGGLAPEGSEVCASEEMQKHRP